MVRDESPSRTRLSCKFGRINPCPQGSTDGLKVEDSSDNNDSVENDLRKEQKEDQEDVSKVLDELLQKELLSRLHLAGVHGRDQSLLRQFLGAVKVSKGFLCSRNQQSEMLSVQ